MTQQRFNTPKHKSKTPQDTIYVTIGEERRIIAFNNKNKTFQHDPSFYRNF